jgi:phage terminase large subunit-like protein
VSDAWSDAVMAVEQVLAQTEATRQGYQLRRLFPDEGELRRELYVKHLQFFAAGKVHHERAFIAANRVGKSEAGTYESTLHLTGAYDEYAPWWNGRRFEGPIQMWAAGDTGKTVRDILQVKFLGPVTQPGTGMIPKHLIVDNAVETIYVQHVEKEHGAHCVSTLTLKSYDQRREAFQGTAQHVILLDEEVPQDIYTECLLRTMVLPGQENRPLADREMGIVMLTFTPLMGLTPVVLSFMPGGNQVEGEVLEVAA